MAQQVFTLKQGDIESQSARQQGEFEFRQAQFNARISELNANDALRRGDEDAKDFRLQGKQLLGSQRVALASSGVELDTGSALEVDLDTRKSIRMNEFRIKNNAWREAYGFRANAYGERIGGLASLFAGRNESRAIKARTVGQIIDQTARQVQAGKGGG